MLHRVNFSHQLSGFAMVHPKSWIAIINICEVRINSHRKNRNPELPYGMEYHPICIIFQCRKAGRLLLGAGQRFIERLIYWLGGIILVRMNSLNVVNELLFYCSCTCQKPLCSSTVYIKIIYKYGARDYNTKISALISIQFTIFSSWYRVTERLMLEKITIYHSATRYIQWADIIPMEYGVEKLCAYSAPFVLKIIFIHRHVWYTIRLYFKSHS